MAGHGVDFAVIGGGMMGAPCARHLAEAGHSVALIAAPEPPAGGRGPWASHHDAARITRAVAADADWARLSQRSIARYRDLEARAGRTLFAETGAVMAGLREGPLSGFTTRFLDVAATVPDADVVAGRDVAGWTLPDGSVASVERRGAGWIDPRAMCAAQIDLAEAAGAQVHRTAAVARQGRTVVLADGARVEAGHVVVATGPHAASDGLLPARPAMTVWARTVAFARLDAARAAELSGLPSLIYVPGPDWDHDLYVLPPVRYADGRTYLKIGGQSDGPVISDGAAMDAWFQGDGEAAVGDRLLAELRRVLPDVEWDGTHTAPCAVVWTRTGLPYIDAAGPGVTVLCGGNGAAAKCGDELGRLGALAAQGNGLASEGYAATFEVVWDAPG